MNYHSRNTMLLYNYEFCVQRGLGFQNYIRYSFVSIQYLEFSAYVHNLGLVFMLRLKTVSSPSCKRESSCHNVLEMLACESAIRNLLLIKKKKSELFSFVGTAQSVVQQLYP